MNSRSDYFQRTVKSANTFLTHWQQSNGQLFELTRSHKALRLLLTKPGAESNLLVACLDPQQITASVAWSGDPLKVTLVDQIAGDPLFKVQSASGQIEIISGGLEVAENVRL